MNTNTKFLTCAAFMLLLASCTLLLRGWLIHELSRASTMPQPFAVTAYYTPELSAFHTELGFDMRPQAVPGIGLELPSGPGSSMHMPSSSSIGRITDVQVHVLPEDSILISMAPLLPWLFSILSLDKHLPAATLPQH